MMKLTQLLRHRSNVTEKVLSGKVSDSMNAIWTRSFTSQAVSAGSRTGYVNADYSIFKGKAALLTAPKVPTFNQTNNRIDKKGCIMLTFMPAVGERKYDYERRQVFALSPTEVGSLISLESGKSCEFFHDPSMKSSNAGQVRKSLSVSPYGEDSGFFFNLSVVNNIQKTNERFSVPVSKAEFAVLRTAFSYILPHIMGWDQYTKQVQTSGDLNSVRLLEKRPSPNSEWDR